ncbi:MAG: lysylphosphatidylglycerol synthase transmembrane domain-containing protein [Candidatus Thiodiazotropha sp.]
MTVPLEPDQSISGASAPWLRLAARILGLVLLAALLVLGFLWIDLHATLEAWSNTSWLQIVACCSLVFISHVLRAGRLYDHFHEQTRGHFRPVLRIALLHNLFNNLMPMRTGESALPVLLKRYFGIPFLRGTAGLIGFRLVDLTVLALLGAIGIASLMASSRESTQILWVLLSLLGGLLCLFILYRIAIRLPGLSRHWMKVRSLLPNRPGGLLRLGLWTLAIWLVKLLAYALIVDAFIGQEMTIAALAALSGELASSLPVYTPAAAGSFEAGVLLVLLPSGISKTAALTAAINLHLFLLLMTLLGAGIALSLDRPAHEPG